MNHTSTSSSIFSAQVSRFLIVGGASFLIDLLVYRVLLLLDIGIPISKGLGFIIASIFAYYSNKNWTFQSSVSGSTIFIKFCLVYVTNFGANIGINSGLLILIGYDRLDLITAFLAASFCSAILNFFGMKVLVFRDLTQAL
jgi:putative flippase GtrA